MQDIRWDVLGTGVIANEMDVALAKNGKKINAMGNRTYAKAVAFAEKYGIDKVNGDVSEMFSDPDIDVITADVMDIMTRPRHEWRITYSEEDITGQGHPDCPVGEAGAMMLQRMNEAHEPVTLWGMGFLPAAGVRAVLDIGCGGGATLARLQRKYPEALIYGVDYSPVSVAQSKEYNKEAVEAGRVSVVDGSVDQLPFPSDSFEAITTVESFYFWPNPVENLKEVRRVLGRNGTFCLIADIYDNGRLTKQEKENVARYQLHNPTKEKFLEMFQEAGFSNICVHTEDGTNWICVEAHK